MNLRQYMVAKRKLTVQFESPISGYYWHEFLPQSRLLPQEIENWYRWGVPIEDAMPRLNYREHNMFMYGYTLQEQIDMFGEM